jgi:hypothetical protein
VGRSNPLNVCGGIIFTVMGLACAWVGVSSFRNAHKATPPWSPLEARQWLIALVSWAVGWICFGVVVVRDSQGMTIQVPAGAPLIDQIILYLSLACLGAGFILAGLWAGVHKNQIKRSNSEHSADS